MKKIIIFICVLLMSSNLAAQDKYWFVSVNLAGSAFYGNEEIGHDFAKSPFKGFRDNLGMSLAVGHWFSPEIALRTKVNGFWGRYVISEEAGTNAIRYMVLNEQVLLDVTNLFGDDAPDRKYHLIPFFGAGFGRNMTFNRWATNLSVGVLNQYRLTDRLLLNAEVGFTLHTREFNGPNEIKYDYHSLANEDRQFLLEMGITYIISK